MKPYISVIIPVLNEEKYIDKCLNSIKDLDYPKHKYEIILVDNGSRDNTIKIAKKFKVKILIKPKVSIGALRNAGAKIAKGNILAFTDADCEVDKNWLKIAINDFKENEDLVAVGSRYFLPNGAWLEKLWVKVGNIFDKKIVYLPGGNFIIKKDIFKEVNGFDEKLITAEDPELCYRLYKNNYFLKNDPNLKVIHSGYTKNIFHFIYKKIWYTLSYFYLFRKYGLKTKMGLKFLILLSLISIFIGCILLIFILNYY